MSFAIRNRKGEDVAQGKGFYRTASGNVGRTDQNLVGANGEYNGLSKKDLANTMHAMAMLLEQGELQRSARTASALTDDEVIRLVNAAVHDTKSIQAPEFVRLGEVFSDVISETLGRMGVADKFCAKVDCPQRGVPRIEIDRHDVVAWQMTSAGVVQESTPRATFLYPECWWLLANVLIDEEDMYYAGQAFLDRVYNRALVGTLVREDSVMKFMFDLAAPVHNPLISFAAFTPTVFSVLRDPLINNGLQPSALWVAGDIQRDIFADTDWQGFYSPVEKHVLFEEGKFGDIGGVEVFTEPTQYDTLRVLDPGEVYMLSAPATLAGKGVPIPMYSEPINKHAVDGSPRRGWWLGQYEFIRVGNSRGVSKGIRL